MLSRQWGAMEHGIEREPCGLLEDFSGIIIGNKSKG